MANDTNLFADIRDRIAFASRNDEQRYQLELHSSRRFANQAAGYFVRAKENSIFRGKPMEKFDKEAAWRFADKWFFGAYMGQIARSMTLGYDQHQKWQTIQQGAEMLSLLADAAADHDPAGSYAQQLQASVEAPTHALMQDGYKQSRLLKQFVNGEYAPTPDKALALSDYLKGMATLHSERAALADMQGAATASPFTQTQKDAFHAAGLLDHAGVPFSSEDYIKQDKTYLPAEKAHALAGAVLELAARQGITVLREADTHGNGAARPMALVRAGQPLSAQEVQQFHRQVMAAFEPERGALVQFAQDGVAEDKLLERAGRAKAVPVQQRMVAWEKDAAPRSFAERAAHQVSAVKHYLSRPQIVHETWKIYNRAVSNQLLALPVNFFEETLRYGVSTLFNKDANSRLGKRDESGAKALLGLVSGRFEDGVTQGDKDFMLRNVKANIFRFVMQPIAGGHGETYLKEAGYAFSKGEAVLAEDKAREALDGALAEAVKGLPDMGERLKAMGRAHPAQLVLQAPEFADIPVLLQKPEAQTGVEDHRRLATFYERLSEANLAYAEEALAPLGASADGTPPSMAERFRKVLSEPVQTQADAAVALAFARSVLDICREHHALVEYVAPDKRLMDVKQASRLSHYIEAEAEKHAKGQTDLLAFADNVAAHLSASLQPEAVEKLVQGRYTERVSGAVEQKLFSPRSPAVEPAKPATLQTATPWTGKARRDKPHRMGVVRERLQSAELKKEVERLNGRLQGEKWTGTASTLIQAKLRHQNSLFDAGNLAYTAWTVLAYPVIYSKGLVAVRETWDEALFGKQTAIKEAEEAKRHLGDAIGKALALDPQAGERFAKSGGVIPSLLEMERKPEYTEISRIALKPASERTADEAATMRGFFAQTGDRLMADTAAQFAMLTGQEAKPGQTLEAAIAERLATPAETLPDAIALLGFAEAIIAHNTGRVNVLAYLDPKERELKHGELKEVAGFINDQAVLSGIAQGQGAAQDVIRFANVAGQKLGAALEKSLVKEEGFATRLAAKYAQQTAQNISQRL